MTLLYHDLPSGYERDPPGRRELLQDEVAGQLRLGSPKSAFPLSGKWLIMSHFSSDT